MKVLLIGDVVGDVGRQMVYDYALSVTQKHDVDLVIANAENAAGGFGITPKIAQELFNVGIQVITLGNHAWDKREILDQLSEDDRLLRPANYPEGNPGRGSTVLTTAAGIPVGILHLMGRVFMPSLDCPFRKADAELQVLNQTASIVIVDFHAEATSEKCAMGYYLDGRVSAVLGTHTHVQTADDQILPGGTAYLTDVGMTGPAQSVIGFKPEIVLEKFLMQTPRRLETARGPGQLSGVVVDVDEQSGRAVSIVRVTVNSD